MKNKINLKKGSHSAWSLSLKSLFVSALIVIGIQAVQAQEGQYSAPTWYFGVAAGTNANFYEGSTNQLSTDFTPPTTFHKGNGFGLFLAPSIEFYKPNTRFGFILQAGLDSRKGNFDQQLTDCNCPANLSTDLSYITVEPSLRYAPFKSNLYFYGGPRFAFVQNQAFTYEQGINPNLPNQMAPADVEGDFSAVEKTIISAQIGAGYDIPLSSNSQKTQFTLSPFIAFHPYFGQNPRAIETWNLTTIRAGVVLKFGQGHRIDTPVQVATVVVPPKVDFTVDAPLNIPEKRIVREIFPLRNYVYFDLGSTEISNRYKLLKKGEVKAFSREQLETEPPLIQSGRSARQMNVYYNVINILGDRMVKYPSTSINLVGSSKQGPEDAEAMAGSVKSYLVDVFGINATRISIKGQFKPEKPEGNGGVQADMVLLREGDRRVSIESNSSELLMEFQSGPNAPLKPIEIVAMQEAPIDSYVTFSAKSDEVKFKKWSLEISDAEGVTQKFGPYTGESVSISGKSILGTRPEGTYNVKMIGQTESGDTIVKETSTHMVLWTPSEIEEGIRYSIIFEFDQSTAPSLYKEYLSTIVSPKIPENGTVIIHGHTDIIGERDYNKILSTQRANEVKDILKNSLLKVGRNDVTFKILGLGEAENVSPFDNKYPEERAYNRTVIIDIIPSKI
ncbi:OmpA family protein [Lacinutrix sp. Hel_I_90]|uniref:OmpA family protein n=1 Tax=Lacinutrix sp. Hel_I_90 TaxID=1249999 RepID=UPI0005C894D1|nr:OmpA family protein [Lacinutrix sp. Hel_I_90]